MSKMPLGNLNISCCRKWFFSQKENPLPFIWVSFVADQGNAGQVEAQT